MFAPAGVADAERLRATVARLAEAQRHRGPDGEGAWSDGRHCALGHRRLAVIDLSPGGRQPMSDASGRYTISFNGEIYNFRELRAELEAAGQRFRSRSDTEVLLAAYAKWGEAAFARLDGMFALALYDGVERCLVLARDRAGEKPLFYARLGERYVVASELRAIASLPDAPFELDARAVFDYLALRYVHAPRTILRGVRALEPGTMLRIGADGSLRQRPYYAFDRVVDPLPRSPEEAGAALEDALAGAIERRLIADVPLGAFLSGGIDSGLVCAVAARRLGRELRTFCAGFAGAEEDETAAARRTAEALGLPHRQYVISSDDLLATVRSFGDCLDEPNGDRSCVPVYLLAREMRREVTVALSGDGGDELFCGYGRYLGFEASRRAAGAHDAFAALAHYFERALPVFAPTRLAGLFPEEHAAWRDEFLAAYAPVFMRASWSDAQRLSVLDFHTYLPGAVLAKVDRMSMRHALEVRTPFFDPGVMQLAASLEPGLCTAGAELKPVLRRLLGRYLDERTLEARKIGFGMPASFMQAHRGVFEDLFRASCEVLRGTAFFGARRAALEQLAADAPGNINSLWALTALGMWVGSTGLKL